MSPTTPTHADMPSTLRARNLVVGYDGHNPVLENVDLAVPKGQFLCLLGPNGAGKSTFLRALAGLLPLQGGELTLDGAALSTFSPSARARRIGFLPQEIHPHFSYRVDEAVALGARVAGHGHWFETQLGTEAKVAVAKALERVGALDLLHRPLDELSGGERRRVLVASVLAQEPDWLLLDEPAAMLDLHHQASLFRTLRRLAHHDGLGVLCVTHDFNLAASFADEVILLHQGAICAQGSATDVLTADNLTPVFGEHFELVPRSSGPPAVLPK
ncbi:MAG: hypothetical protein CMJ96_02945 [Planctomycetes bacterium]|nr:hypothetical protein [Planctomycetota bacterium]